MPASLRGKQIASVKDEDQIRELIAHEAKFAIDRNIADYVSLFKHEAVIIDGQRRASGCDSIIERNLAMFREACFFNINHIIGVEISIEGAFASAETDLAGTYFSFSGGKGDSVTHIYRGSGREKWIFIKDGDLAWRIMRLESETTSQRQERLLNILPQ
jgi:hypothetical protein